jgi:hypothetical protein
MNHDSPGKSVLLTGGTDGNRKAAVGTERTPRAVRVTSVQRLISLNNAERSRGEEMEKLWRIAPWVTRLILLPPTLIFALIASRYIAHPVQTGASIGLSFDSALAVTITRVGFGAFPLGCSIFTLWCLISTRRLLTGLGFVATMISVVLIVRIFGIMVDGTTRENMRLVSAEVGLLILFMIGLLIEFGRRRIARER